MRNSIEASLLIDENKTRLIRKDGALLFRYVEKEVFEL